MYFEEMIIIESNEVLKMFSKFAWIWRYKTCFLSYIKLSNLYCR